MQVFSIKKYVRFRSPVYQTCTLKSASRRFNIHLSILILAIIQLLCDSASKKTHVFRVSFIRKQQFMERLNRAMTKFLTHAQRIVIRSLLRNEVGGFWRDLWLKKRDHCLKICIILKLMYSASKRYKIFPETG